MRVKKLQLKNGYKRFHDLTIDLGPEPKRIVALVGPNGCGKSSVLDGMLYVTSNQKKIGSGEGRGADYHSMHVAKQVTTEDVVIDFDNGPFAQVIQARSKNDLVSTLFSFRSPHRHNGILNVKAVKAISEIKLNNYGASLSCDLDDKMEDSYRRLYVKYNDYLNAKDCKPSEAKAKIIGDLNASLKNCLDLEITSIGNIESSKGTLFFKKSDQTSEFAFNYLSSGEKEVVDILLDLYLRQDAYTESVFLIDEPELHINTAIQRKLLIEIDKLIGKDCQIWLTTHSIGFLRALQNDLKDQCQVIYFPPKTAWASTVQVLKPIVSTRAKWNEIFDTALDDLTGLVAPKRIVYCEGKDKPAAGGVERGLDAKVFNNVFSAAQHDTQFVSSGGNTELDQRSSIAIAVLTKVFPDVEIWVLKDRDMASGKPTLEKDRQIYLSTNGKNHRVLKRWELENYLYDKEVLRSYCASKQLTFDESTYDKLVTDVVNQNLKDETGKIKNICGIKTPVNPEIFKEELSKHVVKGMAVYDELEGCIFRRE